MRAFVPLTRAFARVRRLRCSSRHSSNDAIKTIRLPAQGRDRPSRPRRRAGGKASGPLGPRRPVESGAVSWPSGARGWCSSGFRPGEAAATRGVGEEREVERIPEQLRRFL